MRLTRRSLFAAGATLASFGAAAKKSSKKDAAYRGRPNGISSCATCSFFQAPKSCAVVEGAVSPHGWCNLYVIAD